MEQKKSFGIALYTRVSTDDQNTELQLRELRSRADREGWQVVDSYQDIASGGKRTGPA